MHCCGGCSREQVQKCYRVIWLPLGHSTDDFHHDTRDKCNVLLTARSGNNTTAEPLLES